MNTDAPWPTLDEAEARVLKIQAKLHQWATDSPDRRFDDLFNLVADPAFLVVAWDRVRGNRGARSAGVDGVKPRSILFGRDTLLPLLRDDLKAGRFQPLPVRQRMIPKASGKLRALGIPTMASYCLLLVMTVRFGDRVRGGCWFFGSTLVEPPPAASLELSGCVLVHAGLPATVGRLTARRVTKSLRRAGPGSAKQALDGGHVEAAARLAPKAGSGRCLGSVTHSLG